MTLNALKRPSKTSKYWTTHFRIEDCFQSSVPKFRASIQWNYGQNGLIFFNKTTCACTPISESGLMNGLQVYILQCNPVPRVFRPEKWFFLGFIWVQTSNPTFFTEHIPCPSSCRWQFGLKLRLLYFLYYQAWDVNILFKIKTPAHSQAVQGYAGSVDNQIWLLTVCTYVLRFCWTRTRNAPLRWCQPCSNWNLMACWHNLAVVTVSKDTQVVVNLVNSLS